VTTVCVYDRESEIFSKGVILLECLLKANEEPLVLTKTVEHCLTHSHLMSVSHQMSQIRPI